MTCVSDDCSVEVELFYAVVDKSDSLRVVDFDSHFAEFAGVHPSKIKEGKLYFLELLKPSDRERLIQKLRTKNRYIYNDFELLKHMQEPVFIYSLCENIPGTNLCRITMSNVLCAGTRPKVMRDEDLLYNYNIAESVPCPVCLFRVDDEMCTEVFYLNKSGCAFFETTPMAVRTNPLRLDERIADEDRTILFQSVGSSLTSGEQIDMFCHVQRGRFDVSRCRLKAAICGYDREERPVFSAVLIDLDGENDGDDCIFENRAEVAHIG